jgi:hypothetical protein
MWSSLRRAYKKSIRNRLTNWANHPMISLFKFEDEHGNSRVRNDQRRS